MKTYSNPIAEQSKKWLTESLLQLMDEKNYQDISITEIANKADLSRRTFYRNFKTKEDIINNYIQTICEEFILELKKESDFRLPNIAKIYFDFWSIHKNFLMLLSKNNLLPSLLNKYNEVFYPIYDIVKGYQNLYPNQETLEYALAFSAGGFFSLLIKWTQDGMKKSPKELAHILESAFQNALK